MRYAGEYILTDKGKRLFLVLVAAWAKWGCRGLGIQGRGPKARGKPCGSNYTLRGRAELTLNDVQRSSRQRNDTESR